MSLKLFEFEIRNVAGGPVSKTWNCAKTKREAIAALYRVLPDVIIESCENKTGACLNINSIETLSFDLERCGWGKAERVLITNVMKAFLESRPRLFVKFEGHDKDGYRVYSDVKGRYWKEYGHENTSHPLLYGTFGNEYDGNINTFEELQKSTGLDYEIVNEF